MTENCVNCVVYNWPTEDVPVLRCSSCKSLSYCSPECQKEHWKKVHRKQCKTLAGKVEVPVSTHLPKSCPGCKEEQELGMESITSQDCPAWGCLVGPGVEHVLLDDKFPSAVESGEMARKFSNKTEHTLFVMQQIVHKLMKSNSRLFKECRAEMTELAELLAKKRMEIISAHHHFPAQFMVGNHILTEYEFLGLGVVCSSISTVRSNLGPSAEDPFLAAETLKLLAGFLLLIPLHKHTKDFERLGMMDDIPTEVQQLVSELCNSTKFEEIWDSVLEALKVGLVHHHILLDILCEGNRHQECSQCQKSVIVERVYIPYVAKSKFEKPFVSLRGMVFSCAAVDCQMSSRRKADELLGQVTVVVNLKVFALGGENTCDNCFMLGRRVHRCSQCKTKVYCGEECQMEDWQKIHEKMCNKGEVARKVKIEKFGRVEAGNNWVDEYKAKVGNMSDGEMKQMLLEIVNKIQ